MSETMAISCSIADTNANCDLSHAHVLRAYLLPGKIDLLTKRVTGKIGCVRHCVRMLFHAYLLTNKIDLLTNQDLTRPGWLTLTGEIFILRLAERAYLFFGFASGANVIAN